MKLAYIDSSIWIARVEGLDNYKQVIDSQLKRLGEEGWIFCVSEVVLLEVTAKPHQKNQDNLIQIYNRVFEQTKVLKSYSNVFINALMITKSEHLKGMDTIHISIAIHHRCGCFVTSDPHFKNLKIIPSKLIPLNKGK